MTVRERLREFIRASFLVDELGDDESFLATGVVDSLGIVQLVSFVEVELGTPIPSEELVPANFDSVARLSAYVERKRAP